MGRLLIILASMCVIACLLAACGSHSDSPAATALHADPIASEASLAGQLPAPSALAGRLTAPRSVSEVGDTVLIAGEDYSESLPSQKVSTFSGSAFLDGGWSGGNDFSALGYAMYQFDLNGLSPAPRIRADWIVGSYDQLVYVALANFELDRWSWFTPAGGSSIELPSLAPYLDAEQRMIVLVMNAGAEFVQLASVSVGSLWDSSNIAQYGEIDEIQFSDMELASVGGLPAFAYTEELSSGDYVVRYTRALDEAGSSWTEPIDLLGPMDRQGDISLLEVNGRPALAYQQVSFSEEIDQNVSSLYYMRATDALGESWGEAVLVDPGGDGLHGQSPFLAIISGRPAMSYKNEDSASFSEGLMYVRAADADGSAWGEPVVAAPPVSFGYGIYDAPLAEIAGMPAIAFQYGSPFEMGYVRALDESGEEWGLSNPIFTDTPAGYSLFLQEIGGLPALVYDNDGQNRTSFIIAEDAEGSFWGDPVIINESGEGDPGSTPLGVAQIGGMPAVLIKQFNHNRIVLCRADDAAGSTWGAPEHVTYVLQFSSTSKLLQIDSRPGFVSVTGNQLVYSQYD